MVIEEGVTQREVAQLYNVKPALIYRLVKSVRLAKNSYDVLTKVDDAREARRAEIKQCVSAYLESGQHIWTAQQVRRALKEDRDFDAGLAEVRAVMRRDFDMRYRVLKKVAY